MNLQNNNNNK